MRELLAKMVGKKVDIFCGGSSSLRGKLVKVDDTVAHLVDEDDRMFYVSIERVVVFSESPGSEQRAGFVKGFVR
jgi:small nuclear ribonucleoprotein (snRNP)-like protein